MNKGEGGGAFGYGGVTGVGRGEGVLAGKAGHRCDKFCEWGLGEGLITSLYNESACYTTVDLV